MCGRFATQNMTWSEIVDLSRLTTVGPALNLEPRFNIAPTQLVPVVRQIGDVRECVMMQWWLTPHWAKEPSQKYAMFNAKVDGIEHKPAFREPIQSKRCLIPAMNFFEWKGTKGAKVPYYIGLKDLQPFCFAGVWDRWVGTVNGESKTIESFAILTTNANTLVAQIHHRMPVLLPQENYDLWLEGKRDHALEVAKLPFRADQMKAFPVDKAVGNVKNDGPDREDLIAPQGEFFKA